MKVDAEEKGVAEGTWTWLMQYTKELVFTHASDPCGPTWILLA